MTDNTVSAVVGQADELGDAPAVEGTVVTEETPADDGPAPLIAGTFALYGDGQDGFVLVTQTTQHGLNRRHIPAGMVKLATKLAQGGGLLSGLFR